MRGDDHGVSGVASRRGDAERDGEYGKHQPESPETPNRRLHGDESAPSGDAPERSRMSAYVSQFAMRVPCPNLTQLLRVGGLGGGRPISGEEEEERCCGHYERGTSGSSQRSGLLSQAWPPPSLSRRQALESPQLLSSPLTSPTRSTSTATGSSSRRRTRPPSASRSSSGL